MAKLVGITGGIGSGKSFVSRILRTFGYMVYDCDLEARRIMDTSCELKESIAASLGAECIAEDGSLNRPVIASKVFSDDDARTRLNALVHIRVLEDLNGWRNRMERDEKSLLFVESAILASSGIADLCQAVWLVIAPRDVRISRVISRSGISPEDIGARIDAQVAEENLLAEFASRVPVFTIDNSPGAPVLSEVNRLLDNLKD